MSGSEGKQNSQLSTRDMEEEEMAQELMNMEMYEDGMDFEQMKQILRFINESKNMAGIEPENRSSQEVSQYSEETRAAEVISKNNSLRELITEENSLPKPSYSYRLQSGRASPTTPGRQSSLIVADEEMSVASPDLFDNEETKRTSTDGESIYDELVKENEKTNEKVESRSQLTQAQNAWQTSSDCSQNSQSEETNIDNLKSNKNQRIERWKLDPTNAVVDDNDVPLKEKTRPILNERVPYSFCHNRKVFEANIGEKVLTVLSHTLEEVADIWRRKHRPDVSEFQWGSPIKVGANSRNLDNKHVIEEADSPERCEIVRSNPDSIQRRNMDRNCKRKAAENVRDLINDQVESNEDSDGIFERIKKPKKSDPVWQPSIRSIFNNSERGLTRQEKIFNNLQNSNKVKTTCFIDDYESDDFDNDDLSNLREKNQKKNEEMARASSPETKMIPRRIIPPNPSKPRVVRRPRKNGQKGGKRKSPVKKNTQAVSEKDENSGLSIRKEWSRNPLAKQNNNQTVASNENETRNEPESDEPEENDVEIEIKPLPVKGLADKLQHGTSMLLERKKTEERLEQAKMQKIYEAEMEERMQKQNAIKTRNLKEEEERKEKEAKELARKAKEETWKKNEATRERERRRKQAEEKKRSAKAKEGVLLMDDDDDSERVQCPICRLEFSKDEIQNHAADCQQYDNLDEPGTSSSPVDNDELTITNDHMIYDCHICSQFTTTNGIVYEEHVNNCLNRKKNRTRSQNLFDSPAQEVVEAPTSPIRSYVPISALTESEINYSRQFPEKKVERNTARMKRRR